MVALELVDMFPEWNGALPHRDGGRWWTPRGGRLVEVDARLRVIDPGNERPLVDPNAPMVGLHDGGTLAAEKTATGFAIVKSTDERFNVDVGDTQPFAVGHPKGIGAVFEFPMGQDGTYVIGVDVSSGAMDCRELLSGDECVIYGFSPDGAQLLVGPYPNDPSVVRVLSWPDGQILHELDDVAVGAEEGFGLTGGYLGTERTVMLAAGIGVVIAGADLADAELIDMRDELGDGAFIERIVPLDDDHLASVVWFAGNNRETILWRVV
jgi:hypothetical protein